jgi:hypothetical protein
MGERPKLPATDRRTNPLIGERHARLVAEHFLDDERSDVALQAAQVLATLALSRALFQVSTSIDDVQS